MSHVDSLNRTSLIRASERAPAAVPAGKSESEALRQTLAPRIGAAVSTNSADIPSGPQSRRPPPDAAALRPPISAMYSSCGTKFSANPSRRRQEARRKQQRHRILPRMTHADPDLARA
jgi:hypothetical protein